MSPEDNQPVAIGGKLTVEVDGHFLAVVDIDLKTIFFKIVSGLLNKILVRLKDIELVNYGSLKLSRRARTFRAVKVTCPDTNDGTSNSQRDSQPEIPGQLLIVKFTLSLSLSLGQCLPCERSGAS